MRDLIFPVVVFFGTLYFLGEDDSKGDFVIEKIAFAKALGGFLVSLFAINLIFLTPMHLVRDREEKIHSILGNTNLDSSQNITGLPSDLVVEIGKIENKLINRVYPTVYSEIDRILELGFSISEPRLNFYLKSLQAALINKDRTDNEKIIVVSENTEMDSLSTRNSATNYFKEEALLWCKMAKQFLFGNSCEADRDFQFRVNSCLFSNDKMTITWVI